MQHLFSQESDFDGTFVFDINNDPKIGIIMCADGEGDSMVAEFIRPNGIREKRLLIQEWKKGNIVRLNLEDAKELDAEEW